MRERDEKTKQAQTAMLFELENALELYFFMPENDRRDSACGSAKESLNSNAAELKELLTAKEFLLLRRMVNAIHKKDPHEISEFLRGWLRNAYLSQFQKYFTYAFDYTDFLDKRAFSLINKLRGIEQPFEDLDVIEGNTGMALFERNGSSIKIAHGGVVYLDGKLDYNDIFDEPVIVSGFGKTERYEGEYRNGIYEGAGTEYSWSGERIREGRWRNGELLSGTEYNWLIHVTQGKLIFKNDCPEDPYDATDNLEYESLELYDEWTISPLEFSKRYLIEDDIGDYFIVDMIVSKTTQKPTNIRTLRDFLKTNNPMLLREITSRD